MSQFKRFLVAADNHGCLIDKDAEQKILDFADTWKPHYRIHLGDLWDFSPLRRGASQEERADGISQDYDDGIDFLNKFRPQYLTLGNHDDRIFLNTERCADGILRERCEALVKDTVRIFEKRRIKWCPYKVGSYLRMPEGGPKLLHGFRSSIVSPAKLHHHDWGSCLHGHVHKPDSYTAVHADGGASFSVGCLGDIEQMTYADRQPSKMGWRAGFLYGLISTRDGSWHAWNVVRENGVWISPQGIL